MFPHVARIMRLSRRFLRFVDIITDQSYGELLKKEPSYGK